MLTLKAYAPAASSYYPTYAPALFIPQPGAIPTASGVNSPAYSMAASMGSPVATAGPYSPPGSASSPDFHAVLDSFVRSTGLAPQGSLPPDQEAAASSLSQPGVIPAFSWKRLYSFPFYFSTDSAGSGSRINIPYMKQHIRRTSDANAAAAAAVAAAASVAAPIYAPAPYPQVHEHHHHQQPHPYALYDLQESPSNNQYRHEKLKSSYGYKESPERPVDYMAEGSSKHAVVMDPVKEANLKALNTLRQAQEQTKLLQAEVERSKEAVAAAAGSSDPTPATIYRYYSPSNEYQMKQQDESI